MAPVLNIRRIAFALVSVCLLVKFGDLAAMEIASEADFPLYETNITRDGKYSVYAKNEYLEPDNDDSQNFLRSAIYLIDNTTQTESLIFTGNYPIYAFQSWAPIISADGSYVAFRMQNNGRDDLYHHVVATGETRLISDGGTGQVRRHQFSGNGRYLIYSTGPINLGRTLLASGSTYLFDYQTGERRNLGDFFFGGPMSHNGKYIPYSEYSQETGSEVYLYDVDNDVSTVIHSQSSSSTQPRISENGQYVRFYANGILSIYDRVSTETYTFGLSTECIDTDGDGWGFIEHDRKSCRIDNASDSSTQNTEDQITNPILVETNTAVGVCNYSSAAAHDGWGWNNTIKKACPPLETALPTETTQLISEPNDSANDCDYSNATLHNGWGWNPVTSQSCAPLDECDYSNALDHDGWGWNASTQMSCPPSGNRSNLESIANNDCNYSNALLHNGWGWDPVAGKSCPPIESNVSSSAEPIATRVNLDSLGSPESGRGAGYFNNISPNGRYVVFSGWDTDLVPFDTNDKKDLFVRDQLNDITRIITVTNSGEQANGTSEGRDIAFSAHGRYLAYSSEASNLAADPSNPDTNRVDDVFVFDLATDTTTRITNGNNSSGIGTEISHDGRYIVFCSSAYDLIENQTIYHSNVYVHDRITNTTQVASLGPDGQMGDGSSCFPKLSGDGRWVAFESDAGNFIDGVSGFHTNTYLRNLQTGEVFHTSVNRFGESVNDDCSVQDISADGSYVLLTCEATNLVLNSVSDNMYLYDRENRTTSLIDIPAVKRAGESDRSIRASGASMSDDARYIVFRSGDRIPDLNLNADRDSIHIYRYDRLTNTTEWLTDSTGYPKISADGRYTVFYGPQNILDPDVMDSTSNLFLVDFLPDSDEPLSMDPLCPASNGCVPFGIEPSWNGDISGE